MSSSRFGSVGILAWLVAAFVASAVSGCFVFSQPTNCGRVGESCCAVAGSPACQGLLVCRPSDNTCVTSMTPTCGAAGDICCPTAPRCQNAGYECDGSGRCAPSVTGLPPYSLCTASTPCRGPTTCTSSNLMLAGQPAGNLCTQSCTPGGTCPVDGTGRAALCIVTTGASGLCHQDCSGGVACPTGSTCAAAGTSGAMACVPGTGVAPGPAPYDTCTAGQTCSSATTCVSASLSTTGGAAGNHCSVACNAGSTCPRDRSGAIGQCILISGVGQCYQTCPARSGCPTGTTCSMPSGTTTLVCVPNSAAPTCGSAGQACCTGSTCNAGLACAGTVCVAPPAAYEGCSAASLGAACASATTCQRPMTANPGPTGWCTRACSSLPSECPSYGAMTFNCYQLQGATGGQCYVDCPAGTGCPTGTVCLMTNTMTTSGVRLCMPPAA